MTITTTNATSTKLNRGEVKIVPHNSNPTAAKSGKWQVVYFNGGVETRKSYRGAIGWATRGGMKVVEVLSKPMPYRV